MINLILIGLGPHAKRIYYPIYKKEGGNKKFQFVYGVDLLSKKKDIQSFLEENQESQMKMLYLDQFHNKKNLPVAVEKTLDGIVKKMNVKGIVIATEPSVHFQYAKWALKNNLSILMDKPVSVRENSSVDESSAREVFEDYRDLEILYRKAKKKNRIIFSLMAQRRYHPAFLKIRNLIEEVYSVTNCPVTSVQSFHSDGQWRLPNEIVDLDYHSFNKGYGKCAHSGYHFFDILVWLIEAAEGKGKNINNVDIFSSFVTPKDFLFQLDLKDYSKIFKNFNNYNRYSNEELIKKYRNYGEIDAFNSFAFKHNDRTVTLGSVNLIHNGFSKRGWMDVKGKDLYKGNGRVRHESHFIQQGPFQAISYLSFQSKEIDPKQKDDLYKVGGEYHLEINVFRNSNLFPKWKNCETIKLKDLNVNIMEGKSRGHQEDARRNGVIEFLSFLRGEIDTNSSDFLSHKRGAALFFGVYKSNARKIKDKNPLVNLKL